MKTMSYIKGKYYKGKGTYIESRDTHYPLNLRLLDRSNIKKHHVFGTGKYDANGAQILYKELIK